MLRLVRICNRMLIPRITLHVIEKNESKRQIVKSLLHLFVCWNLEKNKRTKFGCNLNVQVGLFVVVLFFFFVCFQEKRYFYLCSMFCRSHECTNIFIPAEIHWELPRADILCFNKIWFCVVIRTRAHTIKNIIKSFNCTFSIFVSAHKTRTIL